MYDRSSGGDSITTLALAGSLLAAAFLGGGCAYRIVELVVTGSTRELIERPDDAPASSPERPGLLVLAIDGVNRSLLYDMLRNGELPAASALLGGAAGGGFPHAYFDESMLATLPTSTIPAWVTAITGVGPAVHGVTGNEFFIREQRRLAAPISVSFDGSSPVLETYTDDYLNELVRRPTVYEQMRARDPNVLIWVAMHQLYAGADRLVLTRRTVLVDAFEAYVQKELSELADHKESRAALEKLDGEVIDSVADALEDGPVPDVLTVYVSGTDLFAHVAEAGLDAARREYLREVLDPLLGRLSEALAACGALENRYVVVTSDHGHTEVPHDEQHALGARRGRSAAALVRAAGFRPRPFAALAWLARVCTFLRDLPRAYQLYRRLLPFAEMNIVLGPDSQACLGSCHRYLGLLAATAGLSDAAVEHLESAIAMNQRMGARPVTACCQHELARVLQYRGMPGDRTRARQLIDQARATSLACGMSQLLEWIERLGPIEPEQIEGSVIAGELAQSAPATSVPIADPLRPAAIAASSGSTVAVLRRDGEVWQVGLAGESFRMKDTKGVHLLTTLLRHPRQEIHVLDLAAGAPGAIEAGEVPDRGDAGPMLDPAARAAYKSRLEDLRDELEEAERFNDPARAERARHEIDFLAEELARGVGLGGRDRRAASAAERARVNATRTIGSVVKKIASLSPRLGEHLRATVRTGYLCVYAPDPTSPIRWEL